MKRMNKMVSAVVLICFLINTAISDFAFAQDAQILTRSDKLGAGLLNDDILGSDERRSDMAKVAVELGLKDFAAHCKELTIKRLKKYFFDNPQRDVDGTEVRWQGSYAVTNGFCVKCKVGGRLFDVLFELKPDDKDGFPVVVLGKGVKSPKPVLVTNNDDEAASQSDDLDDEAQVTADVNARIPAEEFLEDTYSDPVESARIAEVIDAIETAIRIASDDLAVVKVKADGAAIPDADARKRGERVKTITKPREGVIETDDFIGVVPRRTNDGHGLGVVFNRETRKREIGIYPELIERIDRLQSLRFPKDDSRRALQQSVIDNMTIALSRHEIWHGTDVNSGYDLKTLRSNEKVRTEFARDILRVKVPMTKDEIRGFAGALADLAVAGKGAREYVDMKAAWIFYLIISVMPEIYADGIKEENIRRMVNNLYAKKGNAYFRATLNVVCAALSTKDHIVTIEELIEDVTDEVVEDYNLFFGSGTAWYSRNVGVDKTVSSPRPAQTAKSASYVVEVRRLVRLSTNRDDTTKKGARKDLVQLARKYGSEVIRLIREEAEAERREEVSRQMEFAARYVEEHLGNVHSAASGSHSEQAGPDRPTLRKIDEMTNTPLTFPEIRNALADLLGVSTVGISLYMTTKKARFRAEVTPDLADYLNVDVYIFDVNAEGEINFVKQPGSSDTSAASGSHSEQEPPDRPAAMKSDKIKGLSIPCGPGEGIVINDNIEIKYIMKIDDHSARIVIKAPRKVTAYPQEIYNDPERKEAFDISMSGNRGRNMVLGRADQQGLVVVESGRIVARVFVQMVRKGEKIRLVTDALPEIPVRTKGKGLSDDVQLPKEGETWTSLAGNHSVCYYWNRLSIAERNKIISDASKILGRDFLEPVLLNILAEIAMSKPGKEGQAIFRLQHYLADKGYDYEDTPGVVKDLIVLIRKDASGSGMDKEAIKQAMAAPQAAAEWTMAALGEALQTLMRLDLYSTDAVKALPQGEKRLKDIQRRERESYNRLYEQLKSACKSEGTGESFLSWTIFNNGDVIEAFDDNGAVFFVHTGVGRRFWKFAGVRIEKDGESAVIRPGDKMDVHGAFVKRSKGIEDALRLLIGEIIKLKDEKMALLIDEPAQIMRKAQSRTLIEQMIDSATGLRALTALVKILRDTMEEDLPDDFNTLVSQRKESLARDSAQSAPKAQRDSNDTSAASGSHSEQEPPDRPAPQKAAVKPAADRAELASRISVSDTDDEMGRLAAAAILDDIHKTIDEKGYALMLFASAPSQHSTWKHLIEMWKKLPPAEQKRLANGIIAFHMDEYVGLPENSNQLFGKVLRERLFSVLGVLPKDTYYFDDRIAYDTASALRKALSGQDGWEAMELAARLDTETAGHIREIRDKFMSFGINGEEPARFDIVVGGIGEDCHVAFNSSPDAKFNDTEPVKLVALTEESRLQQVHDGEYDALEEVPTHAITFSLSPIFSARRIHIIIPQGTKAKAVKKALDGEITESIPASGLRLPHVLPNVRIYLTKAAAALSEAAQASVRAQAAAESSQALQQSTALLQGHYLNRLEARIIRLADRVKAKDPKVEAVRHRLEKDIDAARDDRSLSAAFARLTEVLVHESDTAARTVLVEYMQKLSDRIAVLTMRTGPVIPEAGMAALSSRQVLPQEQPSRQQVIPVRYNNRDSNGKFLPVEGIASMAGSLLVFAMQRDKFFNREFSGLEHGQAAIYYGTDELTDNALARALLKARRQLVEIGYLEEPKPDVYMATAAARDDAMEFLEEILQRSNGKRSEVELKFAEADRDTMRAIYDKNEELHARARQIRAGELEVSQRTQTAEPYEGSFTYGKFGVSFDFSDEIDGSPHLANLVRTALMYFIDKSGLKIDRMPETRDAVLRNEEGGKTVVYDIVASKVNDDMVGFRIGVNSGTVQNFARGTIRLLSHIANEAAAGSHSEQMPPDRPAAQHGTAEAAAEYLLPEGVEINDVTGGVEARVFERGPVTFTPSDTISETAIKLKRILEDVDGISVTYRSLEGVDDGGRVAIVSTRLGLETPVAGPVTGAHKLRDIIAEAFGAIRIMLPGGKGTADLVNCSNLTMGTAEANLREALQNSGIVVDAAIGKEIPLRLGSISASVAVPFKPDMLARAIDILHGIEPVTAQVATVTATAAVGPWDVAVSLFTEGRSSITVGDYCGRVTLMGLIVTDAEAITELDGLVAEGLLSKFSQRDQAHYSLTQGKGSREFRFAAGRTSMDTDEDPVVAEAFTETPGGIEGIRQEMGGLTGRIEELSRTRDAMGAQPNLSVADVDVMAHTNGTDNELERLGAKLSDARILLASAEMINETAAVHAAKAGAEIPTAKGERQILLVNSSMFKDGERQKDIEGFIMPDGRYVGAAHTFDLEEANTASVKNILKHLENIIGIENAGRVIVQVPNELTDIDIAKLKNAAPGLRVTRIDTTHFRGDSTMTAKQRMLCRFDMYAGLVAQRQLTIENIQKQDSLYRMVRCFLMTHMDVENAALAEEYMNELVKNIDGAAFIVKHNLSYRPAERLRRIEEEYHAVSIAYLSA